MTTNGIFPGVVRVQDAGVAQRHRILASYEVAGRVSKQAVRPGGTPDFRRPVRTDSVLKPTPGTWCRANFLDVVWVQDAGVAQRHWILASYEVAGRVPKEVVRPGGTPDFRRPVRTDSVLKPTPAHGAGLIFSTLSGFKTRSRGATLDISQLRSGWARAQGSCASWRDAGFPPSRQDGFGFATNPGTWCRANFPCRIATAETSKNPPIH